MKKIIIAATALVLATPAMASKARLQALGDDKDGSFFINDFRNIFLNSAHVNNHKDQVFLELGGDGDSNLDRDGNQKAMGGFLKTSGNLVYGLYLGNESDLDALLRSTATTNTAAGAVPSVDNVTDFFIGGEMGDIQWGANLVYASGENEANKQEDTRHAVRLGMIKGDLEAFANISTGNESKDTDAGSGSTELKFDGKMGYHVGGSYQVGDWTPFVSYKSGKWDNKEGTTTTEGTFTEIKVGAGHTKEISKDSRIFTRINYFSEEVELKFATTPASAKLTSIPLVLGYETQATSWLTLRGSVSTNLMGERETKGMALAGLNPLVRGALRARYNAGSSTDTKGTLENQTSVNAGATLTFGKLSVDGMIGTSGDSGNVANATEKKGVLALDRLMTRVAMTYSF